jgi:hypothetical protein
MCKLRNYKSNETKYIVKNLESLSYEIRDKLIQSDECNNFLIQNCITDLEDVITNSKKFNSTFNSCTGKC